MNYWDKTLFIHTIIKYLRTLIYVIGTGDSREHGRHAAAITKLTAQHDIQTSKEVIKIQSAECSDVDGVGWYERTQRMHLV